MNRKKINWFVIFVIVAVLVVSLLYFRFHIDKKFIGIVETKSHLIGAQEPGTIRNILVEVGDQIKKGQVLATLDISDLEIQIKQLKGELSSIEALKEAHEDRYFLEYQRLAANLADRLSVLEAKRTELNALNTEIERLTEAENAGLGHSRDLADLVLQRDVLNRYLEIQSEKLQTQTQQLDFSRKNRYILKRAENNNIVKSMLSDIMERTEDLRRELSLTEHRVNMRTIVSPCDGYVVELFSYPGDVVDEFVPILSLEETEPEYLTVYLPEKTNISLATGMQVRIYSARLKKTNIGKIAFVHPGLTQTNERLSFRGQLFWARRVLVKLQQNHGLLGGEVVYVRINHFGNNRNHTQTAEASENQNANVSAIKDMMVPSSLLKHTRFEPSGVVWLSDLGKYLIVSDDTGIRKSQNDHAPYLFFMSSDGHVDVDPVSLEGIKEINDLEAVAQAEGDIFYFVSSQNISKGEKRPKNREQVLRVKREGCQFTVLGKLNLLTLIMDSYTEDEVAFLGLKQQSEDERPLLNIEGAAWYQNALYFGLKEPVSSEGAIVWKLDHPETLFSGEKLNPDQLTVFGRFQLDHDKDRFAGFSDLAFDPKGNLWALSTFANVSKEKQTGGLHRINFFANGRLEVENLAYFQFMKPEGLTFISDDQMMIVFDNDGQTPAYCVYDLDK